MIHKSKVKNKFSLSLSNKWTNRNSHRCHCPQVLVILSDCWSPSGWLLSSSYSRSCRPSAAWPSSGASTSLSLHWKDDKRKVLLNTGFLWSSPSLTSFLLLSVPQKVSNRAHCLESLPLTQRVKTNPEPERLGRGMLRLVSFCHLVIHVTKTSMQRLWATETRKRHVKLDFL